MVKTEEAEAGSRKTPLKRAGMVEVGCAVGSDRPTDRPRSRMIQGSQPPSLFPFSLHTPLSIIQESSIIEMNKEAL